MVEWVWKHFISAKAGHVLSLIYTTITKSVKQSFFFNHLNKHLFFISFWHCKTCFIHRDLLEHSFCFELSKKMLQCTWNISALKTFMFKCFWPIVRCVYFILSIYILIRNCKVKSLKSFIIKRLILTIHSGLVALVALMVAIKGTCMLNNFVSAHAAG